MVINRSFDGVAADHALILILGSMPGIASLEAQQYYAHPRNLFWEIMGELIGFDPRLPYSERLEQLQSNRIALWDVAHRCERPGSLDSNIRESSVVANDFNALFQSSPQIGAIFFNGQKAAKLYQQRVIPTLPERCQLLPRYTLPST
ncbi:MAG TPA: DNA-deoxyinosine glycosylase, partial [Mariprofundaceae bacterium]|nr:DNA-deoxyinosine glycosylase [Mariprofundaceae bacterium]